MAQVIHNRSCLNVSKDYVPDFFKATISSPPYKRKDGYSDELIIELVKQLYLVTKPKGLAFINFASLVENWGRPFDVYDIFTQEANWLPVTTIIWIKSQVFPALTGSLGKTIKDVITELTYIRGTSLLSNPKMEKSYTKWMNDLLTLLEPRQIGHYTPIKDNRRMNNLFEYIHVFCKDELPELDRLTAPNGVPFSDKSNLTRGSRGQNGDRHDSGNLWFVPHQTRKGPKSAHVHEYPLELVTRCLALAKVTKDDYILDPFCGGASTLIACQNYGTNGVGYELNLETTLRAQKRLDSHAEPETLNSLSH